MIWRIKNWSLGGVEISYEDNISYFIRHDQIKIHNLMADGRVNTIGVDMVVFKDSNAFLYSMAHSKCAYWFNKSYNDMAY